MCSGSAHHHRQLLRRTRCGARAHHRGRLLRSENPPRRAADGRRLRPATPVPAVVSHGSTGGPAPQPSALRPGRHEAQSRRARGDRRNRPRRHPAGGKREPGNRHPRHAGGQHRLCPALRRGLDRIQRRAADGQHRGGPGRDGSAVPVLDEHPPIAASIVAPQIGGG